MKENTGKNIFIKMMFFMAVIISVFFSVTALVVSRKGNDDTKCNIGAVWYSGEEIEEAKDANAGDFFIDTDDYLLYQKNSKGEWVVIIENFGKPGEQGSQGEPGEDGINVYIGYDGYVWNGEERTDLLIKELDENVAENTIELKNNKYFDVSTIKAGEKIALMANYFKYIKSTQYSGSTITEISTYVSAYGNLDIGVINLLTKEYVLKQTINVEEGFNTVSLNIEVGENETIVLGGDNTTVDLYKSSGVNANDEYGLFTTDTSNFIFSQTNGINDKVIINVKAKFQQKEIMCTTPELEKVYTERTSGYTKVVNGAAPFIYQDASKFAGVAIKSMKAYINSVSYEGDFATMDIALITVPDMFEVGTQLPSYNEIFTIRLPIEFFDGETTINKWVEIDFTKYAYKSDGNLAKDGIIVGENETLVFAANKNETVLWGFNNNNWSAVDGEQFYQTENNQLKGNEENCVLNFLFYVERNIEKPIVENVYRLEELDKEAYFEAQISGKRLSILGDSISTFSGVSNDVDEGLSNNAVYYTSQISQKDTYWQQILTAYDMNLCVNNSWSGAYVSKHKPNVNSEFDSDGSVSSGIARADDLAKLDGTIPDFIIVYIGINDLNANISANTIKIAYDKMLDIISENYPNAKVFCVNMPNRNIGNDPIEYNTVIAETVNDHHNTYLIDLYNSEFNGNIYQENSIDNLHPNKAGMDYLAEIIVEGMKQTILKSYNV